MDGAARNAAREAEGHAAHAARSAASSARSNAATTRAAQSAATGAWVGAGFQAAAAFQAARAARAHEEQLQLQHAMAAQEQLHQFAMWRQTPEGEAFVQWRERAVRLAQFIRDRDSTWLQCWARAINRAQTEVPDADKRRFAKQPAELQQRGLLVTAIIVTAVVALLLLNWLPTVIDLVDRMTDQVFRPELYLSAPGGYGSTPDEVRFGSAVILAITFVILATPTTLTIFIWRLLRKKQRAARNDSTVRDESRVRIEKWGFDPLAVQPGYIAFDWAKRADSTNYADRLMQLALQGHTWFPSRSQLLPLSVPPSWEPHPNYPDEVNQALAYFQQQHAPRIA